MYSALLPNLLIILFHRTVEKYKVSNALLVEQQNLFENTFTAKQNVYKKKMRITSNNTSFFPKQQFFIPICNLICYNLCRLLTNFAILKPTDINSNTGKDR